MGPITRYGGRPNTVRQPTPESQQPYLPSSNRNVKSKRPPTAKSKSKRKRPQQTITQMPLLHQLYHPELYHANLEYEEAQPEVDIENDSLAVRSPKRRKICETPSKEGKTGEEVPHETPVCSPPMRTGHESQPEGGGGSAVKDMQAMPPPTTTPKRPIRKEIPSSQSPLDTPLSALSRRSSNRDTSRSPLKERSINLQIPIAISPKGIGGVSTREVADSMETEDEDEEGDPPFDSQIDQGIVPGRERLQRKKVDPGEPVTSHIQVKTSFPGESLNESARTTRVGSIFESPSPRATSRSLGESDAAPRKPVNASPQQRQNHLSNSQSSNTRVPEHVDHVDEPLLVSVPSSPPPQKPDVRSRAAHCLPPLAVETDSQFEAAWQTYHPTPIAKPLLPPSPSAKENSPTPSSQLQYIPSSQPIPSSPPPHANEEEKGNATTTQQPTQPLPNQAPHHPPPVPQRPYVPASQATTTASPTQPQHYTPHHDNPHILVPSSPSPPQPPTPLPPGFSSPVIGRKSQWRTNNDDDNDDDDGSAKKHEWDPQRRVRDSQLLPASFLQDSWFVGPDDIEDGDGDGDGDGGWIEEGEE